ncbi:uncharacterized protein [Physcomitrium patens]|uniref:MalT-like TPR region domain-containing protein n=2 Tax=Physcomitrium patens TaxID=3218 RepID=A0A2K1J3S3_PHYPA|nr:uncharacterized protein LOC112294556 [Physcomitrium patens]XP_024400900.1 uncharacterized protein LOC112294556 [Physcomitrium patens]PNR36185.1 hypothetical protein PHYPA_022036 [Physcomitrium patens]|eukprot:XP_024400899.1 uncharacterized protein LOC112294556 [Physcomitrella patens]
MAAGSSSRRLTKECFHRLVGLGSILAGVRVAPLSLQSSVKSAGLCHAAENVRKICPQSAWQVQRIEVDFVDPKVKHNGQQRWYARNDSEKAKPDADSIATEMIKYAASCRSNESAHVEAIRVLEQGRTFLLNEGSSAAPAAGRVLLTLATFHCDRGECTDAVEALQVASDLKSAGLGLRVAALEALAGLCLRLHEEGSALKYAHSCGQLVMAAGDSVPKEELVELQFRSKAVALLPASVCARHGAADTQLFEDVPKRLEEDCHRAAGVAVGMLSVAQCAHIGGYLKIAGDLYRRTISILQNSKESSSKVTLASCAMTPEEVQVGALAGLGQLACHVGDFDEAESKITEALTQAEKINGDKHPRVGIILACLADVYARRGKVMGSGDSFIIAEGLYRRCQDYLRSPSIDVPDTGKIVDLVDVMCLSRARYAEIIHKFPNRDEEADKIQKWASKMWKGPRPLLDLMKVDSARTVVKEKGEAPEDVQADETKPPSVGSTKGHVVIDVRLGRVMWKVE